MKLSERPLVHPDRQTVGFKPFKAWKHFRKLVADKEDTAQVFHIIEATKSKKSHRQAWDFVRSDEGKRFLKNAVDIPAILDDHDRWTDCGPNTVAQHYMRFMMREGLSAAGLVAESHRWLPPEKRHADLTEWYFERLRDTHDLFHVLTSYGRDALGEQALLGFSYEQNHNPGILFIAYAGAREIKKATRTRAPLYAAVKEGRELGRRAAKLAHMDVEQVMRADIDAVRKELNIGVPLVYRECLRILQAEGHTEGQLLAPQAA